jgi:hypothetical protein
VFGENKMDLKQKVILGIGGLLISAIPMCWGINQSYQGYMESKQEAVQKTVIRNLALNPMLYIVETPEEFVSLYKQEKDFCERHNCSGNLKNLGSEPLMNYGFGNSPNDLQELNEFFETHEKRMGTYLPKRSCCNPN